MIGFKRMVGNAMVEFGLVAAILVPAVLAIPVLSKIADVNMTGVQASRYSIWERTVFDSGQKSDAELIVETRNRFFAKEDLLIVSEQELINGEDANRNFWKNIKKNAEESTQLIKDSGTGVVVVTSNKSLPNSTGAGVLSASISAAGNAMEKMVPDAKWNLEEKGFYTAEVIAEVAANRIIAKGSNCDGLESDQAAFCMRHKAAIFTDSWDANSPKQVEERVKALVPAGVFNQVGNGLSYIGAVPLFHELKYLKNIFGHVEADVLPPDRHGNLD